MGKPFEQSYRYGQAGSTKRAAKLLQMPRFMGQDEQSSRIGLAASQLCVLFALPC
jgi:hypothetical protein